MFIHAKTVLVFSLISHQVFAQVASKMTPQAMTFQEGNGVAEEAGSRGAGSASPLGALAAIDEINAQGMRDQEMGNYLAAERNYVQATTLCRKLGLHGRDRLAASLNNLGSVRVATGRLSRAREALTEALRIRDLLGGADDQGLVVLLSNLGTLALELGDDAAAERYYTRALLTSRSIPGGLDTASVINNLAALRFRQGRFDEAASALEGAIETLVDALGSTHPRVGRALLNLLAVRIEQGRLEDAESVANEAFRVLQTSVPSNHPDNALLFSNYAKLLKKTGRSREARRARKRAKKIWQVSREENLLDHTIDVSAFSTKSESSGLLP